jgi:hypothetical protein
MEYTARVRYLFERLEFDEVQVPDVHAVAVLDVYLVSFYHVVEGETYWQTRGWQRSMRRPAPRYRTLLSQHHLTTFESMDLQSSIATVRRITPRVYIRNPSTNVLVRHIAMLIE